jgi:DNA replication protein DnaC
MNINITSEESTNNDFLIIFDKWKERPNRLIIHDTFIGKDFEEVVSKNIQEKCGKDNTLTELLPSGDDYVHNQRVLLQVEEFIFISFVKMNMFTENFLINDLCFYFKSESQKETVNKIINELSICIVDYEDDTIDKINVLESVGGNLELSPLLFEKSTYSLESLYNHKSIKKVKKLIKEIKDTSKGLSIIYGDKGVGKTNLSKYISSKIDRLVIYVPINMVDSSINSSEFRSFLKKYSKCFLIVDDCEFLYNPIYGKNNYFSSNILQLVDSVVSEQLELQVLLIFNVDNEDEIDECLLDSNNLLDVINIEELDSEVATELSKELGFNKKIKNDTRLVDVFKNNLHTEKNNIGLV